MAVGGPVPVRHVGATLVLGGVDATGPHLVESGSNVDACVITATKTDMLRNFVTPNERVTKERTYGFRRDTTAFTKEEIRNIVIHEEIIGVRNDAVDVNGS